MSFLDQLPPEQRDNIVSLPYRVGLWISLSDASGGDESDADEEKALLSILHGYAQEVFGSETVQYVISETIKSQDKWAQWAKNLKDVPGDCIIAVDKLSDVVDEKEVNAYRHHLVEIGEAVALAFREYEEGQNYFEKAKLYLSYYKGKLQAYLQKRPYKSFDQFLNISMDERKALGKLAHALDTKYY